MAKASFSTRLRKNDEIIVLKGRDKGKRGQILKFFPSQNKILVKGVNLKTKHLKPSQEKESGGIEFKEAPISIANVALALTKGKNATLETTKTKMVFKTSSKNSKKLLKVRISKKSGKAI